MMKEIDFDLVNKKKDLGKRRVSKVASSIQRIVTEIIHGEFAMICNDFSVVDAHMSVDLRYADISVSFFHNDKKKQEMVLKKLNSFERRDSYFLGSKTLNIYIASKISQKMRLRNMPDVRFKMIDDDYCLL